MNWFSSTPGQFKQAPSAYTEPQQGGFMQALQMALSQLQNPTAGFQPIAQKYQRQFQTDILPSIAERFASMGAGAQDSSGYQSALTGAGMDLSENLAGMESQYGLQQQQLGQNLLGMGLTPQNQFAYQDPQQSGIMRILQMLAKGAGGAGAGFLMGGGSGGLGSGFSDLFGSATGKMMPGTVARGIHV